jgi:hypothetical protein
LFLGTLAKMCWGRVSARFWTNPDNKRLQDMMGC